MAYTTINKSSSFMNPKLYTGNGASSLAVVTGIDLTASGGLCIAKNRTASNKDWYWVDTVRGASKTILSNGTGTEQNYTTGITGFNNNGFQVGSATQTNGSGNTLVGYNFKAGSSVAGSTNTAGSIYSTVTANTTSGFSIVKWTGNETNSTIGHGTGKIPTCILIKNLSNGSAQWVVYHVSTGNTQACYLNTTTAPVDVAAFFQDTTPTSSVFTIGTDTAVNGNNNNMIAYVFSDIQGFSKMGSYVGNGNVNGTFCFTGMKPSFVMVKRTNSTGNWSVYDDVLPTYNVNNLFTMVNTADPQEARDSIDFLSNGFKLRNADLTGTTNINVNGSTYLYMAFGQSLVGTNNTPATAR